MFKRGGRKQYKARRRVRRVRKMLGLKRDKYADTHSFKTTSVDTSLVNINDGTKWVPKANGQAVLGLGTVTIPNTQRVWLSGSFVFMAQSSLQWTQLNSLFDRYRVNGIKVKFIPEFNVQDQSLPVIPTMKVVRDYDDNTVSTVGDIWSRRGIERRLDKPFSVYIKNPRVLTSVQALVGGTTISTVSAGQAQPYLNCGNGNVFLLGLKYAIKDWPVVQNTYAANVVLRMEITYYFTFKQQINPALALNADTDQFTLDNLVGEPDAIPCENQTNE